jgi:hypothetical protein
MQYRRAQRLIIDLAGLVKPGEDRRNRNRYRVVIYGSLLRRIWP